jgi:hypothetical protein
LTLGGGTSAVAASTHASCPRFRGTDPLITRRPRRALAKDLGHPDTSAGVPEGRWSRAMAFERLVRDERFASQVATRTVGGLELERPESVVIRDAGGDEKTTAMELDLAHARAIAHRAATLIHRVAVPFPGFEDADATSVLPDFIVVTASPDGGSSWLIAGDAKDYERVRSRIDDQRMLKGYLQVALGAEAFAVWSKLPTAMQVHSHGVLAVPRNAFLQPQAVTEDLSDHRDEVRMRIEQRLSVRGEVIYDAEESLNEFVAHLEARFDPAECPTCPMFRYCRAELRASPRPDDLLIELGVPANERSLISGLVGGDGGDGDRATPSVTALVRASLLGKAQWTGQRRIDPIGLPGTIDVVAIKADSAALGVHGIAIRRWTIDGSTSWQSLVFADPLADITRRTVMTTIGEAVIQATEEQRLTAQQSGQAQAPIHIVVPDSAASDLLASIADVLAGVEISRLRWQRDVELKRPVLTFDGEPATIPDPLDPNARTAVSYFLEQDRGRAMTLRSAIVTAQEVLTRHLVAGGPRSDSGRLDYLLRWAGAGHALEHRAVSDEIEQSIHTPGARLSVKLSDEINAALKARRATDGLRRAAGASKYEGLVTGQLSYQRRCLDQTVALLGRMPISALRPAFDAVERSAQEVWRRRLAFQASDLVRFGRTYRFWRNALVGPIEGDRRAKTLLTQLVNPIAALDRARDSSIREIAQATVASIAPIRLEVDSRHIRAGSEVVLLHRNGRPHIEDGPTVTLTGGVRILGTAFGPLSDDSDSAWGDAGCLVWTPPTSPQVNVGDDLIIALVGERSYDRLQRPVAVRVQLPAPDTTTAPKTTCQPDSYVQAPADGTAEGLVVT